MPTPELDPATSQPTSSPYRDGAGFTDLRGYAPIGDGRTVGLVALDGAIDWLPLPELASLPAFAALLDPANGGRLELSPTEPFTATRRYLPDTNVLETTFTTESGEVRVTDAMNLGVQGRLPWSELVRRVEGVSGDVLLQWRVAPGTCFNTASPWARQTPHGVVFRVQSLSLGVCVSDGMDVDTTDQAVTGSFRIEPGQRRIIGVIASHDEPLMTSTAAEVDCGLDRTIAAWTNWSGQFSGPQEWRDVVRRSVLTLKLLLGPAGSIAAAATTSLPERLAGGKNWDYRYAWVRDTAYTVDALHRFGLREETHASVSWLLRTVRRHGPEMGVLFGLDGSPPEEPTAYELPGWRNVGPVVTGNRAGGQLQLSLFADLFDTVRRYVDGGHALDTHTGHLLTDFADQTCDAWRRRDAGMWELPRREHYTSSKMGCWHALRCAVHLAELGQIPGDPERWTSEADRIAEWIRQHCWSDELQSYEWYPGSGLLDTSVLLHAGSGFDDGQRMSATIEALRKNLGTGPWLYRYSGAQEEGEGTFVACSFWMVSALRHVQRRSEATALMTELVAKANDVGIFAEMVDPDNDAFLGNLPQGLSHLALIGAAGDLCRNDDA